MLFIILGMSFILIITSWYILLVLIYSLLAISYWPIEGPGREERQALRGKSGRQQKQKVLEERKQVIGNRQ